MRLATSALVLLLIFNSILWTSAQDSYEEDEAVIRLFYYPDAQNSSKRHELDLADSSSFQGANLEKGKRAKILIHGAGGDCTGNAFPFGSVEAYLRVRVSGREDYNVFCLDYHNISTFPSGIPGNSQPSTREWYEYTINIVGNKTARFILALEQHGIIGGPEQVHVIGHSLGGQVSGATGRKLQEMVNFQRQVGRITGLDVMNIYNFNVYQNEVNLANQIDSSDATFVDIVHTNDGQIGLKGDYGRVDYYPDGGEHQKMCLNKTPFENLIEMLTGGCSHGIVGSYWAYSIEYPPVPFCKANSYGDYQNKKDGSECSGDENTVTFGEYVSPRRVWPFAEGDFASVAGELNIMRLENFTGT